MVSHLQAGSEEDGTADGDDFLALLDERLMRSNLRKWQKLQTWAGVLDAAGWCVALPDPEGGIWLSPNARLDLESRGDSGDLPEDLTESPAPGVPATGGCRIWGRKAQASVPPSSVKLTRRETEIFHWLREGKTDGEISLILGCAVRTVEKHVANLYQKLGVGSRAAAILHSTGTPP